MLLTLDIRTQFNPNSNGQTVNILKLDLVKLTNWFKHEENWRKTN